MVPKSYLIMVSKDFLIMVPKGSLIIVPKSSLIKDPKSTKSSLIKKLLQTFFDYLHHKINFRIKSKFAAGQLKLTNSPLHSSTESLTFVYPIMHNGQILFKNIATFTVKFLKRV